MCRKLLVRPVAQQSIADTNGNIVRIECSLDREEPVALLIFFADANRLVGGAVELFAHLHLDERALLLDPDNEIESLRDLGKLLPADRPHAGDLETAKAQIVAFRFVDAELIKRLAHVQIGFTGRDDADFRRATTRRDDAIETIGA